MFAHYTHALQPHCCLQPRAHACRRTQPPHLQPRLTGLPWAGPPPSAPDLTWVVFPSEEELTLTRENSIRRLHSHRSDPRSQVCAGSLCCPGVQPSPTGPLTGSLGAGAQPVGEQSWSEPAGLPWEATVSVSVSTGSTVGLRPEWGEETRVFVTRTEWTEVGGKGVREDRPAGSPVLTPAPCPGPAAGGECRAESRGPP